MNTLLNLAGGVAQESPSTAIFFPSLVNEEQYPEAFVFPPEEESQTTSLPALRLAGVLQTSLELEQVLRLFSAEITPLVPHDGLTFFPPSKGEHLSLGRRASHSVSYCLTLHDRPIGTLLMYRDRRFVKNEVDTLEDLLRGLLYPLRNSLLYQEAVIAALRDPLTGIGNRAALDLALEREVRLAKRNGIHLSMLVLDVDRFKRVNDTYGHSAGDCVLRTLAHCVSTCVRATDLVARFGGEELAVLLNNTDAQGAYFLAERIRCAVEATQIHYDNHEIQVTVSIGVANLHAGDDGHSLFCRADTALYRAKESGRNRTHYNGSLDESSIISNIMGNA
ncbi:hypothetical protein CCP3SC5AM1_790005 [Gammaproteobacteria bacterium]